MAKKKKYLLSVVPRAIMQFVGPDRRGPVA